MVTRNAHRTATPPVPSGLSHERRALLPAEQAGRYSISESGVDQSGVEKPAPHVSTLPEMPAVVRVPVASRDSGGLASSRTHPEMPAVRARGTSPAVRQLPSYSYDDDEITELSRNTDVGSPPSLPAQRDRSLLLRMDGAHAGKVVALDGACRIGRHPDNELPIDDHGVSRFHAALEREPEGYFISDGGSRNGTYVQGQRITRVRLQDGDWIQLGPRVSFRFTLTDARQERLLGQLFESSTRDALTGAYNRKHFDERLSIELAYAKRHATNASMILMDIDHFKRVNDRYGHLAGDAVLRAVAVTVNASLRAEDIFARYGGEEFAVILRGIDLAGAARAAERLRVALENASIQFEGERLGVTASMGVASVACIEERTPALLVAAADRRLYAAKAAGRNRIASSG